MAGIFWQLGAILWVLMNGHVPLGMLYICVGMMFVAREKNRKLHTIATVLAIVALVLAVLKLVYKLDYIHIIVRFLL